MPVSKAQQRATNKYKKSNYDRIELVVPKGNKETIRAVAETHSQSINAYISAAIDEKMKRDTGGQQEAKETGVVSLPPEALKTAQEAAEAAGEGIPQFIARAIESRATLDKRKRG